MSEKTKKTEESVPQLMGGSLIAMLEDVLNMLKSDVAKTEDKPEKALALPMDIVGDEDFEDGDPVVDAFKNDGGCKGIIKIMRFTSPEEGEKAIETVASAIKSLSAIRMAYRRDLLRKVFAAIQTVRGVDNEAVVIERTAAKLPTASRGYYQAEAVSALEALIRDTAEGDEKRTLTAAKNGVLAGEEETLDAAGFRLRNLFASSLPSVRTAYTSLSTQQGEPYMLCPKGASLLGHAIPMETSKCRENCIDSRLSKDGSVTCQYATWLRVSADSHDKAMSRLDEQRHPGNEANLLTLAEGQRANPMKPTDVPREKQFEDSKQGANKFRDKKPAEVSIEAQLENAKKDQLGHRGESESINTLNAKKATFNYRKTVVAQTSADKTLEEQVPKNKAVGDKPQEQQIEEANKGKVDGETPRENKLDSTETLIGHRGEMTDSYAHQLANGRSEPKSVPEQLNDQKEIGGVKVSDELNKTASKEVVRLDPDKEETVEQQIEDKHDESYGDETIEEMLADEHVGLSEEELDMLLEQLLEQERNSKK